MDKIPVTTPPTGWQAGSANDGPPEKKRRINRSVKTCSSCRKSKARCEVFPGRAKCQRCSALRTSCDLPPRPENPEHVQPLASASQVDLLQRLESIESRLGQLTSLIHAVVEHGTSQTSGDAPVTIGQDPTPSHDQHVPSNPKLQGQPTSRAVRPVLLVRNLQTQFFGPKRDFSDEQLSVGSVLSAGIISASLSQALLRIFVKHYGSWVSIDSVDSLAPEIEHGSPLLFSTACLLAAKHVTRVQKQTVDEMYTLVRRLVSSVVLMAPPLDYFCLQALTLLSLFTPTVQSAVPIDSWLISGMAINHAILTFNLNASELPISGDPCGRLKQLRVWNALCLTNVQFSIGNGRPSAVHARFVDQCALILGNPGAQHSDSRVFAEVLLYTRTEVLLADPSKIPFKSLNDLTLPELSEIKTKWSHIFDLVDCLSLKIGYWYCHLLLYRATLSSTDMPSQALTTATLSISSDILTLFQELEFSIILDMPDHFFFMIIYAALTLCKFAIGHPLIASTESCLMHLAPNDEHIAYRFGTILSEIRRKAIAAGAESEYNKDNGRNSPDADVSQRATNMESGPYDWRWDAFLSWGNFAHEDADISSSLPQQHSINAEAS